MLIRDIAKRVTLVVLVCIVLIQPQMLAADPIAVRHTEGVVHGFLALRTIDGETIADGDLKQSARGGRVTSELVFHFKDGSLHDETAVYSQLGKFRLLSDHLIQKGPAFKHPMDLLIDGAAGKVTVRTTDDDGKEKIISQHVDLPLDVANGMVFTLMKNIRSGTPETKVSMMVATPKPRVVKLAITPQGEEPFSVSGFSRKATHYTIKIKIGGAAGVVAPLVGKQPPDIQVWILEGEIPAFVRSEGPLFAGGPIWRIELASPVWPQTSAANSKH